MNTEKSLHGHKVAILVADGFEQSELAEPKRALEAAGATTEIVSPSRVFLPKGSVRAWKDGDWGDKFEIDVRLSDADVADYDALLLPGGVLNPDKLKNEEEAVQFVRAFFDAGKPVAAICHGPWLLVDADVLDGRTVTSYPSIKQDLKNAGAHWVDQEVVVDQGLVTSRTPKDIPAFNRKMIEEFAEGIHYGRRPLASGLPRMDML